MFSKIAIGLLVTGIAGGLVYGAINRTQFKLNDSTRNVYHNSGIGRGQGNNGSGEATSYSLNESKRSQTNQSLASNPAYQSSQQGTRNGNAGRNNEGVGNGDVTGIRDQVRDNDTLASDIIEWITLEGIVSTIDSRSLIIASTDGKSLELNGRSWTFAQDQGLTVTTGDRVSLYGFYDSNGVFETGYITNLETGVMATLRNDAGQPLWGGKGNGRNGSTI